MTNLRGIAVYSMDETRIMDCIKYCGKNKIPNIRYQLMSAPRSYEFTTDIDFWSLTGNGCWVDVDNTPTPEERLSIVTDRMLRHALRIKRLCQLCAENNVKIIIDWHLWWGSKVKEGTNYQEIFFRQEQQDLFVEGWKVMAAELKDCSNVTFLDLANEPAYSSQLIYTNLISRLYQSIKAIDPNRKIIVEGRVDDINNLLRFDPTKFSWGKDVIWSGHFYWKSSFSLAGKGVYPNKERKFTKEDIKTRLVQVRDWANRYQVELYCGEVGVDLMTQITYDQFKLLGHLNWIKDSLDILYRFANPVWHDWFNLEITNEDNIETVKKKQDIQLLVNRYCK